MEYYQRKVIREKKDLDLRTSNLERFMKSSKFLKRTENEQTRLYYQLETMSRYSSVLGDRIKHFK